MSERCAARLAWRHRPPNPRVMTGYGRSVHWLNRPMASPQISLGPFHRGGVGGRRPHPLHRRAEAAGGFSQHPALGAHPYGADLQPARVHGHLQACGRCEGGCEELCRRVTRRRRCCI